MNAAYPPAAAARSTARAGWGAGRVIAVIVSCIALLAGLAALAGGGTALVIDQTQRDASGYLMTGTTTYSTGTFALVSDSYRTGVAGDPIVARDMLGTVRIRTRSFRPVFVGIGPAAAVDTYLSGVRREVAMHFDVAQKDFVLRPGGAPAAAPATKRFWVAKTIGTDTKTLCACDARVARRRYVTGAVPGRS